MAKVNERWKVKQRTKSAEDAIRERHLQRKHAESNRDKKQADMNIVTYQQPKMD